MESGARTQASARLPAAAPLLTGAAAGEQLRGSGCRTATVRTDGLGGQRLRGRGRLRTQDDSRPRRPS